MMWNSRYLFVTICFVLFSGTLVTCAKLSGAEELDFTQTSLPIIWYAPFFSGGGYCSEAISFVLALHYAGVRIKIVHHGDSFSPKFVSGLPQAESSVLMKLTQTIVDPSDAIVICHSEPGAWHPSRWPTSLCPPANSKFKIGRTMFETDRIPDGWNERLNKMDEVWVPTKFHTATFQAGGTVIPIRVVGEPVDTSFFDPGAVDTLLDLEGGDRVSLRETRFLSIFKWEARKGWDILLKAYIREFASHTDEVRLYLLTNPFHGKGNFDEQIDKFITETLHVSASEKKHLPKIHILKPGLNQIDLPRLYKSVDALVQPSRGEGWGRPHVEAMSMSLPVIATNWSGTSEFLTNENSYPLEIESMSTIQDGAFKGHKWAEPSVEHLQRLMRRVHENKDERRKKGIAARLDMLVHYSPATMAEKVMGEIYRIALNARKVDEL